jgi:hypothetical protein
LSWARFGHADAILSDATIQGVNQLVVFVYTKHAVRAEAFDGNRPNNPDFFAVRVGLVVEVFELGLGGDGLVDLLLPGDAGLPPVGVQLLRSVRPFGIGFDCDISRGSGTKGPSFSMRPYAL